MIDELNLAIVDLETTGSSAVYDRIIEIGIKRIERGRLVRSYGTLVDPERPIPPMIAQLTGIRDADVAGAPTFAKVRDEVLSLLEGCVFVAHNVRFDYGFLRNELQRLERTFSAPCLCTVRLSRLLYPRHRRHSLSHVIERFNLPCANRHRALDDAEAVWAFLQHARQAVEASQLSAAVQSLLRRPTLPPQLPPEAIDALPSGPGVYVFWDAAGAALYAGKSMDVRDRVLEHFGSPESRIGRIGELVARISVEPAFGDLGLALLEAHAIATHRPAHNRRTRGRQLTTAVCHAPDAAGYLTATIELVTALDAARLPSVLGLFPSRRRATQCLRGVAEAHRLCPRLLGLARSPAPCAATTGGGCLGACVGREPAARYNARLLGAFARLRLMPWPFPGPVLIDEPGPSRHGHAFVVDGWQLRRAVAYGDGEPRALLPAQTGFDVERYALLAAHLRRHPHAVRRLRGADADGLTTDPSATADADAWPMDEALDAPACRDGSA